MPAEIGNSPKAVMPSFIISDTGRSRAAEENYQKNKFEAGEHPNGLLPVIVFSPLLLLGAGGAAAYTAIILSSCAGNNQTVDEIADVGADQPIEGVPCETGEFLPCGPCDLGFKQCGEDKIWRDMCEGITQTLLDTPAACYEGDMAVAENGECRKGESLCIYDDATDAWKQGECLGSVLPKEEVCNSKDDDCDGMTDEGPDNEGVWREETYTGSSYTSGKEPCHPKVQACADGQWQNEAEMVLPAPEMCDNIDNDCDGATDEGMRNACGTCGPAPVEECNGIDDDCDGLIDDGKFDECGGCGCSTGTCLTPSCDNKECGDSDGCEGTCLACPPTQICRTDQSIPQCGAGTLECSMTDRFEFGNDFTSHNYRASPGAGPGVVPTDSCAGARGIRFQNTADWASVTLAVSPTSDVFQLRAIAAHGGLSVQADGFRGQSAWGIIGTCFPTEIIWPVTRYSSNPAVDGAVEFTFRAGTVNARTGNPAIDVVEVESCHYR